MKKSNIFAFVELKKLSDELQKPTSSFKEKLVGQSSYFHIIDPKFLSDELSESWIDLRKQVGYSDPTNSNSQQVLKVNMQERINALSESECRKIVTRVIEIFETLRTEFEGE